MPHRDGDRITTGAARRLADRRGLRWLLPVLDVHQRFSELEGGYLAAGVTLLGFLSLFPLVVVGVSVLGFLSAGRADLSNEVVDLLGLPPGGEAAGQVEEAIDVARGSREAAGVIGLAGLLWSGLGLVGALQHAYNGVWQVQGRGARDRVIGLVWLAGAGVLFLASFGATAAAGLLPAVLRPLNLLAGLAISFGLWLWSSHVLAGRDVGWRRLVPGAAVGAVGLEVLKVVGAWYVPRAVASASALYGSLGLVFALLAWLFFFGRLVVYTAVVDVVHYERHRGDPHLVRGPPPARRPARRRQPLRPRRRLALWVLPAVTATGSMERLPRESRGPWRAERLAQRPRRWRMRRGASRNRLAATTATLGRSNSPASRSAA